MRIRTALLLALALGCAGAAPGVKVSRASAAQGAAPRPPGCPLEFLREKPDRPYDELGELTAYVRQVPPGGPLEALRDAACALGADAVIVLRDKEVGQVGHVLAAGTAIKFRAPPPAPPSEPPGPPVLL